MIVQHQWCFRSQMAWILRVSSAGWVPPNRVCLWMQAQMVNLGQWRLCTSECSFSCWRRRCGTLNPPRLQCPCGHAQALLP